MEERKTLEEMAAEASYDPNLGLVCPNCGCRHFEVLYTIPLGVNNSKRRKRECRHCGREVYTKETIVGSGG